MSLKDRIAKTAEMLLLILNNEYIPTKVLVIVNIKLQCLLKNSRQKVFGGSMTEGSKRQPKIPQIRGKFAVVTVTWLHYLIEQIPVIEVQLTLSRL